MKTIIPCKITYSRKDKCWYVEAPDVYSDILTYGDTLEHAKEMASEALTGLLESYLDDDKEIPAFKVPARKDWYGIELSPSLSFAIWLRAERKSKGMTQTEVADKLGVKYQVYQKLENPETANPTLKTLKKIEKIFETEVLTI